MLQAHLGELAALVTAILWTISSVSFEMSGKRVGSLSVNFIRLIIAWLLISGYNFIAKGMIFPLDISSQSWIWLSISGFVGFFIGDLFLFQAYVEIGARISLLIMSLSPPITALFGYLIMGETITVTGIIGMFVTISGVMLVVLVRKSDTKKFEFSRSVKGIIFAFIGTLGQSLGLIFSKIGMQDLDSFTATQIRIISGLVGFAILFAYLKKWKDMKAAFTNLKAMTGITIGAFFGPFLGVSVTLIAIKYTSTGIASTIASISPVLIIPVAMVLFKERITFKEFIGAIITVAGVALLFI